MLDEEGANRVVQKAYDLAKKAIVMWHDYSMQQIRLESSNAGKRQLSQQQHEEEMSRRQA